MWNFGFGQMSEALNLDRQYRFQFWMNSDLNAGSNSEWLVEIFVRRGAAFEYRRLKGSDQMKKS